MITGSVELSRRQEHAYGPQDLRTSGGDHRGCFGHRPQPRATAVAARVTGVIADVDEIGLRETAASLQGPVLSRILDVRDADDVRRFAKETQAWLDMPLATVFNNAGVAIGTSVLNTVPEDDS